MSALTGQTQVIELDIPAGAENVRQEGFTTLQHPAKLVTFEPHLHASGTRMCAQAILPSGEIQTISCAGYNHNWVRGYVYEDDAAPLLPKGTIIHTIGWYDNSSKNPRNADPRNWKGFGQRSVDDMFLNQSQLIFLTEADTRRKWRRARRKSAVARRSRPPRDKAEVRPGHETINVKKDPMGRTAPVGFAQVRSVIVIGTLVATALITHWSDDASGAQVQLLRGQTVAPVFEGWDQNPDGSYTLIFGYFNRNWEEEVDVPVGPNNTLDPGGPDQGQPTHSSPAATGLSSVSRYRRISRRRKSSGR